MSFVRASTAHVSTGTTNPTVFGASTTAGNIVIVGITQIFSGRSPQVPTNVRDNVDVGVDYTLAKRLKNGAGDAQCDIYYKIASASGTRTVTVTFPLTQDGSAIAAVEYDTTQTASDGTNQNSNSGSASPLTPGTVTASASAVYFAVYVCNNGFSSPGFPASWNNRAEIDSAGTCPIIIIDQITTGAQNPSLSSTSPGNWASVIACFVASGGGGFTAKFRSTLSNIGGRVGSRQMTSWKKSHGGILAPANDGLWTPERLAA